MTRWTRAGITFATIWILVTIVSYLLPACSTTSNKVDQRLARLEYLMDSTIYLFEGEMCDVSFRLCLAENKVPTWTCIKNQEQCEIQASKRFKRVRSN